MSFLLQSALARHTGCPRAAIARKQSLTAPSKPYWRPRLDLGNKFLAKRPKTAVLNSCARRKRVLPAYGSAAMQRSGSPRFVAVAFPRPSKLGRRQQREPPAQADRGRPEPGQGNAPGGGRKKN